MGTNNNVNMSMDNINSPQRNINNVQLSNSICFPINNRKLISLQSNLIRVLDNNDNNNYLEFLFEMNEKKYILKIEKTSHNSILFKCNLEDDASLLYEYSNNMLFDEIITYSKNFRICDNIEQVFNTLKITLVDNLNKSKPRIDFLGDNGMVFFYVSPLISGNYEDISIILYKIDRNINSQFQILQGQYEKLKIKYELIENERNNLLNICERIRQLIFSNINEERKLTEIEKIFREKNDYPNCQIF